ncbi:helix-turn-helix domain-containing protein, partial [Desulfotomaculum copahuensis]|uniref:helix-turn-helix domain-containing protein n=1 Tax=Desulfotomaculum copahuensis TaxID=1838280 RepID=UPI001FA799B1
MAAGPPKTRPKRHWRRWRVKINRAYRYELKPNVAQRILLAKHAGTARFAYNWGLARRI